MDAMIAWLAFSVIVRIFHHSAKRASQSAWVHVSFGLIFSSKACTCFWPFAVRQAL